MDFGDAMSMVQFFCFGYSLSLVICNNRCIFVCMVLRILTGDEIEEHVDVRCTYPVLRRELHGTDLIAFHH